MAPKKAPPQKLKAKTSRTSEPPDWPAFKPLLPPTDLSLSTLVECQIITIHNFWTSTLCKNYVQFLKGLPLSTTPGKPKKGEALRFNDRFQVQDEVFANRLWMETGLRELLLGEVETYEGDREGINDESNVLTLNTKPTPTPVKTTWTLLLYLTSPVTGCQGGETAFYPDDLPGKTSSIEKETVVGLETGMLLLHKHGNDCMLHEGREVTEGEKWVIRTDLCVKREKSGFTD
ncbi:hypothetical protein D0Z07_3137 [Hyphodiscus hymeniophilus]|uniref:Prolyl 4-hydroxylase alpha subunit domain-containing protein n=1 Tax=Hyphodiscus hymeniophilus TaxID=353542 RepID=A0A9P7AYU8_9HELO|nr:hypothetical protein D0Z07_3137 [Hyphodiscus hymeniophilus]